MTSDDQSRGDAPIRHALVTGGAGFIGSHIVDRLLKEGANVVIYDNFSTGQEAFIAHHKDNPQVRVVRADLLDLPTLTREMAGCDFVFHLAANADVRGGIKNPRIDLEQNTIATWNVLEAMRHNGVKRLMFASSATVYGEPAIFPTPEAYAPLQTSLYGASKYAGEAMIQAYGEYYGIRSWTFRFVSWIGERYTHGVIFDFMKKLIADPAELEVLGNGEQKKSYLDVRDGVDGILFAIRHLKGRKNIVNLGHYDWMNVLELARVVTDEMGLRGVRLRTTGGERGWLGDAPFVHLDTTQLKAIGWAPRTSIEEGIRSTVRYLKANPHVLDRRKMGG